MTPNTSPNEDDLSRLSLPELVDLMHRVADEILLREMQAAGEAKTFKYSNKWSSVDGATYGLSISQITFWENKKKYETNEPLIKPFATIAQMFDSWGVFHNGITATELARLHRLQGNNIYVPLENHSLGSQTSAWGCGWFYENVWKYHPDTMLVDFSVNDRNSVTTTGFPTTVVGSDGTVYNNIITQSDYIRNMSDLCNMAISNGIQPIVFGSYLIGTCDYYQALCYAWASQQ